MRNSWIADEADTGELPEQSPHIFMEARQIDGGELRARLREYREVGSLESPWERDQVDVLTTDFLNWDRWER